MKRIAFVLMMAFLILAVIPFRVKAYCESGAESNFELSVFLKDHPEFEYASLIDLDEDGRDEMLVSYYQDDEGLESVSLVVPSEENVYVYPMRSYYSYIAYDPINHCLVASGGGTDAFSYQLLTLDTGNVYEWTAGYEPGFTPDSMYRAYKRTLYRINPEKEQSECRIRLFAEPMNEEEFQKYRKWFGTLKPILLSSSNSATRLEMNETMGEPVVLPSVMPRASAGGQHTLLLQGDGTVASAGGNDEGQRNVNDWNNMVKVCAGIGNSVGLQIDGTVLATGNNQFGQCDVGNWNGIKDISTQNYHTLGLREDETVVATGFNDWGECNVGDWKYIVKVSTGQYHSVGLNWGGAVVASGDNRYGQCDVSEWHGITSIDAGYNHTVGLSYQGNVLATGKNDRGQCNVSGWENVRQIAAGGEHTVALLTDGTVVATGNNDFGQCNVSDWHDIVQISAGFYHTVGVMSDGSLVATGWGEKGQCNVDRLA